MLKDFDLGQLTKPLVTWFLENARELPWREDPSPYHVWISEIMLQQTRVEAVKRYYARFIEALPDVASLAACPEDVYLKLWEGLGYYSRVRNLHAAAVQIAEQYGGEIPSDYETLLTLKGIGHYTAGAIASLAYEKPVPAVDGNVLRILTRVSNDDTDIMKQSFRTEVEEKLKELLEKIAGDSVSSKEEKRARKNKARKEISGSISPRIFNQALMELGALICVPNGQPHCDLCPWKEICLAKKEGTISTLPVKKKAKPRRIEERTVFLIQDGDRVAIRKRPARGLLAGLYEFPNHLGHFTEKETLDYVREMGYSPLRIRRLPDSVHIFSHVEWRMIAYYLLVEEEAFSTNAQKEARTKERLIFVDAKEQKKTYAVPSAFGAYKFD